MVTPSIFGRLYNQADPGQLLGKDMEFVVTKRSLVYTRSDEVLDDVVNFSTDGAGGVMVESSGARRMIFRVARCCSIAATREPDRKVLITDEHRCE
ncbi:hypothetical protein GOBAR_AA15320 [Gossypium barbadense]|uniref:Uncharacterized protein n=1 Tax=Gossypium barbadense TaxID=3634 RepID=A0A2P5XPS3_GOSBA|nr:hypothetical protein GOBAR_AA15320 [Gossypium barbadense]